MRSRKLGISMIRICGLPLQLQTFSPPPLLSKQKLDFINYYHLAGCINAVHGKPTWQC
jgi:hypothetical protein